MATLVIGEQYAQAVQPATQSKMDYCGRHEYDFIIGRELDPSRPVPWSKILLLKRVLPAYGAVFFSDADVIVANGEPGYNHSVEHIFGRFLVQDTHLVITQDHDGHANTGNFLLKNHPWSLDLLRRIWNRTQFIHHPLWKQQALEHLLETEHDVRKHTAVLPMEDYPLVSYPTHQKHKGPQNGEFLIHLSNVRDVGRLGELVRHHYRGLPTDAAK